MKQKKLSEIADIHSGLVLSRKEASVDAEHEYKYRQLNLRSISEDGNIDDEMLDDYISNEMIKEVFITRENDIIMRLFPPIHPIFIPASYSDLVIPSQFAIMRVKTKDILPEFLYLHLSRKEVLNEIYSKEGGHTVRSVKISTLYEVMTPVLPLEKQKELVGFSEVHNTRRKLHFELLHQYDAHANAVIKRIIEGD